MKLAIIGSTGLVGSRILELLSNSYSLVEFNSSSGTDITNPQSLELLASDEEISHVILLAAKADVDGCELDREENENGEAWKINVEGAANVAKLCKDTHKKIIYISTDFVFDGTKPDGEFYDENDTPNPINWYGYTKWKGEQAVTESGASSVIIRIAYPYRAKFDKKNDFVRAISNRLRSNQEVWAVSDHIFNPTFIDDFVNALDVVISQDVSGIYHVVGSESLNPYDAAIKIADTFELDKSLVSSTTRVEYFSGKADRPFNLAMNNDKIKALGVRMRSFEEGLQEVKSQISNA